MRAQSNEMLPLLYHEREEMLVARLLLAQGKAEEALSMLECLLPAAQIAGRRRSALEIQVLMVLAQAARKHAQEAKQLLQTVLSLAYTEGYLRLFLDEGDVVATLLLAILPNMRKSPTTSYLQAILYAFAQGREGQEGSAPPAPLPLVEPLSPQEQRVLRLLAAGRSNPEIAHELIVSVNTIRTQVQSIYRKLNVNNRVAASEVARHLRLL